MKTNKQTIHLFYSLAILAVFTLVLQTCSVQKTDYVISSPDKKIAVNFKVSDENKAVYNVKYADSTVLMDSRLGVVRDDGDFSDNLQLISASDEENVKDDYTLLNGKRRHCSYYGIKRVFHLKNANGQKMDIIFQVSDDGVAFRYYFPEKSDSIRKIKEETTSFHFRNGTKTWIQPMTDAKTGWNHDQPSYEQHYFQGIATGTPAPYKAGWVLPALFHYGDTWMLITETGLLRNYCGCRLQQESPQNEYFIGFPEEQESFPGGPVYPQSTLPWYTPWRVIAVGNLKTIAESTIGTDLASPAVKMDSSFIQPGKASWSWVILKDPSVVYDVQKKFIDYASDMDWRYCLIDANWDTTIGYNKIKELADYAKGKNVGLILWYNSAGSWNTVPYHPKNKLLTHEKRVKEFSKLKEMEIKGIKVDFFGGDGQSMISYYQDIFEDAAKYGLLVNCHGSTYPRGWARTYPNLMSMEAVRGGEFVTFAQDNADSLPHHSCILPFTRNAFDPMDFTPVFLYKIPNIKRTTTDGFELALSVLFLSGIQHYAEIPEGMSHMPDYVKTYMKNVPSIWDDTKFIDGFPGKWVVMARRAGDSWYVAGINGDNAPRQFMLPFPFLKDQKKGLLITDGSKDLTFDRREFEAGPQQKLQVTMKAHGGFVIKLD